MELSGRWRGRAVLLRVRSGYVAGTPEELVALLEEAIAARAVVLVTPTGPTLDVNADDPLAVAAYAALHEGVTWDERTAAELAADQRLHVPDDAVP